MVRVVGVVVEAVERLWVGVEAQLLAVCLTDDASYLAARLALSSRPTLGHERLLSLLLLLDRVHSHVFVVKVPKIEVHCCFQERGIGLPRSCLESFSLAALDLCLDLLKLILVSFEVLELRQPRNEIYFGYELA